MSNLFSLGEAIEVFLPVYQVESVVSYQAIRKPTVFEKLVLNLAVLHQNELGSFNLKQICEVLKIELSFIKQALATLVDNDMLERHAQNLSDVYIKNLKLTTLGGNLYRKDEMPSSLKKEAIPFYYNPLLEKLLVEKKKTWLDDIQTKKYIFSSKIFPENLNHIQQLSQEFIGKADEKTLRWKKPNTNISNINCSVDKALWQPLKVGLLLDHNGNMTLQSKGNTPESLALEHWLKQAQSEVVWDNLIAPAFEKIENDLSTIDWQQVLDVAMPNMIIPVMSAKLSIYYEKSPNTITQGLEIVLSSQAKDIKLQGKVLTVPLLFRLPTGFKTLYLDAKNESSVVFRGNTDIYYAKQARNVALQLRVRDVDVWQKLQENLLTLVEQNIDILAFFRCFLTEQQVIDELPILSAKKALEFNELMQKTCNQTLQSSDWIQKIKVLESMEDLSYFRKLFPQIKLEEKSLSYILIAQIIETMVLENRFFNTFFDELLKPLTQLNQELKSRIQPDVLKQAISHKKINIEKVSIKAIQVVNEWLRAYNAVNNQTPQLMVNTKKLTEQRENLLVWQQLVEQHFAPKRIDGKQVAVFDTSYLMKHSDKLTEISQRQFIIIPQIVLHELDGLKGGNDDEQTERIKQARYAIRIIHSLSEINFESSHTELWHFINDSKNKRDLNGDQQILSVALYHQLNAATLYSLDINLCNLAKLVSIQIAG
jgi:hypothetical protein